VHQALCPLLGRAKAVSAFRLSWACLFTLSTCRLPTFWLPNTVSRLQPLPTPTTSDLPPDVVDLARRLAALPEAVRASLLAAVKVAVPAKVAGRHE